MIAEPVVQKNTTKLKTVEKYVEILMETQLPIAFYFHHFDYIKSVKDEVIYLAKQAGLKKSARKILALAALFQHTGLTVSYQQYEQESQLIAEAYLRKQQYPEDKIQEVQQLIKVACTNIVPASLAEKLLCDANTSYVGQKKYRSTAENLWKERLKNIPDYQAAPLDWAKEDFAFLQEHKYYTKIARDTYGERKRTNLKKAKKRLLKAEKTEEIRLNEFSITKNKAALTMFKTALRNHIDLTAIADQKANMMLSINALILTIGLPVFASYLAEKTYLLLPSLVFMVTCIVTMIFATLSTRPIKMDGETDVSKINTGKTNLFFFGNFYNIDLQPYQEAIKKIIANKENLDNSIINDLYYLGHSLGNKFYYLRTCYNSFIIGMVASLISFLISYGIFNWA